MICDYDAGIYGGEKSNGSGITNVKRQSYLSWGGVTMSDKALLLSLECNYLFRLKLKITD